MTRSGVNGRGCPQCGDNAYRVKRLVRAAERAERNGKPVDGLREQVRTLQGEKAACAADGHKLLQARRGAAMKHGLAAPTA